MSGVLSAGQRLLVFGYFGGRNFGDELMLLGLINEARAGGVAEIRILTPDGSLPAHLVGKVDGAFSRRPRGMFTGLAWASAWAVCGGTTFHDAFSDDRHSQYRRVPIGLAALCCAARLFGCKVGLVAVGIGPIRRMLTKKMARLTVAVAHDVSVRDQASYDDLGAIGAVNAKIHVQRDLAFSARSLIAPSAPAQPPALVVSVVPASLTATVDRSEAAAFLHLLADGLREFLTRRPAWRLIVLEVAVGARDNDSEAAAMLAEHASTASGQVELRRFDGDPFALLATLSSASAVIASRYHVATAAELAGAPTLWLPYARKVADGATELGVPEERLFLPRSASVAPILQWIDRVADDIRPFAGDS